ncbi:MAG: DNA-binding response regulator [Alphaproteobacteria bacterium]|nr:DNA-binding response regulator [Alphaproteobacteria bacterium]
MSVPALRVRRPLRVQVNAHDPARRAALEVIVTGFGHMLASSDTDVILSDGDHELSPQAPTVVLGSRDDHCAGLLPSDATPAQIDAALHAVAAGLIVRANTEVAFGELSEPCQALLTPRETEVLVAISEGLNNKEIARRLEISHHTVKFHIESLLRKLGARSRAEAVAVGMKHRNEV